MLNNKVFILLILVVIFNACSENKLSVVATFIDLSKTELFCTYEVDGDPIAIILKNSYNIPLYFSSYNGQTLKYQTHRIYYKNGSHNTYSSDDFNLIKYDLLLLPKSTDTFYLCGNLKTTFKRIEFILDYKVLNQNDTLAVSIYN